MCRRGEGPRSHYGVIMHSKPRVVIIEDDAILAFLFREVCRAAGWTVCGDASTIDHARSLLLDHSPDLVLLDYSLGKGDGIELLKDIRNAWPQTYVTLVTGWDIEALMARIDFIDPDCILTKPLAPAALTAHLDARRSDLVQLQSALIQIAYAA